MMDIKNKVAVVTGASSGIGLETSKMLLDAGMKVAGWCRSEPEIKDSNFLHVPTDMGDFSVIENAYKKTKDAFGDIYLLVNNAGMGYYGPTDEHDNDEWKKLFDVNVHGVFLASKLVIPDMKKNQEGHIVNISSVAGQNGVPNLTAYVASKHAVKGLSHSLFLELRNDGIKVSCLYPGSVETKFFNQMGDMPVSNNMMQPEDIAATILHTVQAPKNYHVLDIELRPLQPKK